jgi:hypothetical protein
MTNQYYVRIPNLFGSDVLQFTEFSGIKVTAQPKPYRDPFFLREYQIPVGFRKIEPVQLSGPMLTDMFKTIDDAWQIYDNSAFFVEVQPITCHGINGDTRELPFKYQLYGCTWFAFEHTQVSRQAEKPNDITMRILPIDYAKIIQ